MKDLDLDEMVSELLVRLAFAYIMTAERDYFATGSDEFKPEEGREQFYMSVADVTLDHERREAFDEAVVRYAMAEALIYERDGRYRRSS